MVGSHDVDGCLAEFAALRLEIDGRVKAQHQILTLQITAVAAVFGFVVSRPNMTPLLLGIPIFSYLFCSRLVSQHIATLVAAQYVREELSPRVPGGLGWEQWILRGGRRSRLQEPVLPLLLTFPAAGIGALVWSTWFMLTHDGPTAVAMVGFTIVFLVGLAATALSTVLILGIPDGSRMSTLQHTLIGYPRQRDAIV